MRVSPEQLRKALADLFRDPKTRELIFPYLAPRFPVQGAVCNKTENRITKFVDDGGLTPCNTVTPIFENGTGVGVGTSDPATTLHVAKNATYTSDTAVALIVSNLTTLTKRLQMGYDTAIDAFFLQATDAGTTVKSLLLNAVGGNVGIATTSPAATLHVARNATYYSDSAVAVIVSNLTTPLKRLQMGYDTDVDAFFLQATHAGTTVKPLLLNAVGGNVGVGTISPGARFDVLGDVRAKADAAGTVPLTAQGAASQTGNLQQWKNSGGTVLAAITKDGSLVFGGTATKQSSGGPELITAIHSAEDNVILWAGLSSDTEARFLCSARGFLEWGPGGSGDQEIALYRNAGAGISIGNFFTSGPPLPSVNAFRVNAPSKNPPGEEGTAVFRVDNAKQAGVRVRGRRTFIASGTVTITGTSATVVGTSTQFMTEIVAGDIITIVDTGETRTVKSVTDDTHLIADSAFSAEPSSNMAVASFTGFADSESIQTTAAVTTTDGTAKPLFALTLVDGRTYHLSARVIGRKSDGSERAFYWRAALVYRQGSGAAIQNSTVEDVITSIESTNATGWNGTIALGGAGAPNDVLVQVTGASATTIHWVGAIEIQSVATSA